MAAVKLKSKKAFHKRFKSTASGNLKRERAYTSHLFVNKSTKQKRQLRKATLLAKKLPVNFSLLEKNNNIEVGIVIGNAKGETAEIYAEFFGSKGEIYDKFSKELTDLFPIEIKPSKTDNQGKEDKESQELNQEGVKNSASTHEKGSDNKLTTGLIIEFW
ncbi:14420_t:CDS:2 [Entrophospora sp. SA101]|nr:14420_t:CDS:2 [Entrophospora sp. SA101]CAJ0841067.1 22221_t:CDS:2 [Entrophospora sp. SA101]